MMFRHAHRMEQNCWRIVLTIQETAGLAQGYTGLCCWNSLLRCCTSRCAVVCCTRRSMVVQMRPSRASVPPHSVGVGPPPSC